MIQSGDRLSPNFIPIDKHAVERYDVIKMFAKKSVRVIGLDTINGEKYYEENIFNYDTDRDCS